MVYHITPNIYFPVDISIDRFLNRVKDWDWDSLVTDEDYKIAIKLHERNLLIAHSSPKSWRPTIDNAKVYRQNKDWQKGGYRFLISFSEAVESTHILLLKSRGFRVHMNQMCCFGKIKNVLIVAEERVHMEDVHEWVTKFDMRKGITPYNYHVTPVLLSPKTEILYGQREGIKYETKKVLDWCLKYGIEDALRSYGEFGDEGAFMEVMDRYERIKNNQSFRID